MMWFETSLYFWDFLFTRNTHISHQPFKHNLFRELRFWGTQPRRTSSLIIFLCGYDSTLWFPWEWAVFWDGVLDGADTQLCGLRNKCFYGFGKQRLILGFDMSVISFIDYCSLWPLRIIYISLYSIPPSHFFSCGSWRLCVSAQVMQYGGVPGASSLGYRCL